MTNAISIDEKYSTTRLLTKEKPIIENRPEDKFETILFLPEGENRKGEGGLRTKGYFKKFYEDKPLVSIITVVFNGEKYLEQTIQSVINQSYDNVEYIIIDGGSADGTLDIIRKYEDRIDYWVSEKDNGIYDAMNKGIDLVSGDWINFMNAGDTFYNIKTLYAIFNKKSYDGYTGIYGNVEIHYGNFNVKRTSGNLKNLSKGMQFSHQSLFIKTSYHKKNMYDLLYKSASDFNFIFKSYINKQSFFRLHLIVSKVSSGGVSDVNRINSIKEGENIVLLLDNNFKNKIYYKFLYMKIFFIVLLKKILPKRFIESIQKRNIKSIYG